MSNFVQKTWETGETITAGKMNRMEEGISEALSEAGKKVAGSGWSSGKYLGTDAEGNVVAKEAPQGGGSGGATDAQVAEAVAAYMAEHPVQEGVDGEDGYTPVKGVDYYTEEEQAEMVEAVLDEFPKVASVAVAETSNSVAVTYTMDDGSYMSDIITFDADGYPTNINANGTDIPVTWGGS